MLKKLGSYSLYGKYFACIEYTESSGETLFHVVKSKGGGGRFTDVQSATYKHLTGIKPFLGKLRHTTLVLNNNQVLIKHLNNQEAFTEELVHTAFPSIRLDDFYYQAVPAKEGFYIAICRKAVLESALTDLKSCGLEVVAVSLGFSSLSQLKSLFVKPVSIPTGSTSITVGQDGLLDMGEALPESSTINLQDDSIESSHIIALSGLSNYSLATGYSNFSQQNATLKKQFGLTQIFKKSWKVAAAILFALLLINALSFNNLYTKKQQLTEQSELVSSQRENYTQRKSELEQKESLVSSILTNSGSRSSLYLNRIVATVPEYIQLSLFEYQPVQGSIREDKSIQYEVGVILIEGTSKDAKGFGPWITNLESFDFVESVQVEAFADNTKDSSFSLEIKLTQS